MNEILVCFDNNDCLVTKINASLEESKEYYLENSFDGKVAKFVLDTNKNFFVKVIDSHDYYEYRFMGIDYKQYGFDIVLHNVTLDEETRVEPMWFFAYNKRIISQ